MANDYVGDYILNSGIHWNQQLITSCNDRTCHHVYPNKDYTLMYSLESGSVEIVKQTLEHGWGPQCPGEILSEIHHLMLDLQPPYIIKQKINLVIEYKRCDVTRHVHDSSNDKCNYSTLEFAVVLFHVAISNNCYSQHGKIHKLYDIIPILIRQYSPPFLIGECTNILNIPISDPKIKGGYAKIWGCDHTYCECNNYSGLFNDFKQYVLKVKHNKLFCWLRTLANTYFEIIPLDILHVIADY